MLTQALILCNLFFVKDCCKIPELADQKLITEVASSVQQDKSYSDHLHDCVIFLKTIPSALILSNKFCYRKSRKESLES